MIEKKWKKYWTIALISCILNSGHFGEVPKLAEGTPLERVQVVNSGARVQIPPSPLGSKELKKKNKKVVDKHLKM